MRNFFQAHLRRINDGLTVVIIILALYIILTPFWPNLTWWVRYQAPVISKAPTVAAVTKIPAENTLVIPSMAFSEPVHEGTNKWTLHFGVWHLPFSSSPDKGGNTVFAGHRFTYHDPAIFYHLDKVQQGDPITLYWNRKEYDYTVTKILTVKPTETSIEQPTDKPQLTLYTCTPLWTSKYRLVVIATPKEAS
jgi:LPXTG-site transpeptidase (sortase) family protein